MDPGLIPWPPHTIAVSMRAHHLHLSWVQLDRHVRRYGELDLPPRIRVRVSIHQLGLRWEQRVHGPPAGLLQHGHGCPPLQTPGRVSPEWTAFSEWRDSVGVSDQNHSAAAECQFSRSCVWRLCALPALRIPSHCQIVCVQAGPPPTARTDLCCVMRLREWRGGTLGCSFGTPPGWFFFSAVQKCPRKAHGIGLEMRLL